MVLEYDFNESVGYWVMTAAQAYQRALTEEVSAHGITFRQCQVLGCLAIEEPLCQADVAERMGLEPPTLVGILDRMERDGWIRRQNCSHDRRRKLIYSTPAAKPAWSKIVACARRVRTRATRGLSRSQQRSLRHMLDTVRDNLGATILVE